jgi:hypothetical protein
MPGLVPLLSLARATGGYVTIIDIESGFSEKEEGVRETAHGFARRMARRIDGVPDALAEPQAAMGAESANRRTDERHRARETDVLLIEIPAAVASDEEA